MASDLTSLQEINRAKALMTLSGKDFESPAFKIDQHISQRRYTTNRLTQFQPKHGIVKVYKYLQTSMASKVLVAYNLNGPLNGKTKGMRMRKSQLLSSQGNIQDHLLVTSIP